MKRIVSMVFTCVLTVGFVQAQSFPDVPEGHWAAEAVERLAGTGIVVGFPDGQFRGNEAFTRYQAALVIDRLLRTVADSAAAREAAMSQELEALRDVVSMLGEENIQLRQQVAANRAALELLWDELARLREELGLPPPAPLPDAPELGPVGEPGPAGAPGVAGDEAAVGAVDGDARADGVPGDAPEREGPEAGLEPGVQDEVDEGVLGDEAAAAAFTAAPAALRGYLGLGIGTEIPPVPMLRAIVGVYGFPSPRVGARLSLDMAQGSAASPTSLALAGHLTYRTAQGTALQGYGGVGAGVELAGDGAFGSLLLGTLWTVSDPIHLFAETTFDVFVQPTLPSGGSRLAPALVVGARWAF